MGIAATPRYMKDNDAGFYDHLSPAAGFYTFFQSGKTLGNWMKRKNIKHWKKF